MAVAQWRITSVTEEPETWLIHYEPVGDGQPFAASWPKDAFEIRMAEHGLDSLDEAIEVLLYTPLLHLMRADGHDGVLPVLADDVATARARIRDQVEGCKKRYAEVVAAPANGLARAAADPLQVLRERVRVDPVRVATIRLQRDSLLAGGAGG
ncbi:hypothetical protein B0I32_106233 [Nonomuraea fuscirosea]|uniref:Uncharacterized protein n=1 Tax=Nonomuraea fuscirosea TaxID=1291556 RepID=A0A2T0N2C3_9ACTN|nr:hypothetical protein [Nonomuraea fuscirosea]PRX66097.1 hypothetical protein B0I32_106233 [Nonomuraea fuscirosea]